MSHTQNVAEIVTHLQQKKVYSKEYIDRIKSYMLKYEDLADEFSALLPPNTILDHYVNVKGYSIKRLGATTMLSRSAIYLVLSRLKEEDTPPEKIIEEELEYFSKERKKL